MIDPVTLRPRARLDLLEQFVYFGEQAGDDLRLGDYEAGWTAARPGEGIRRLPSVLHAAHRRHRCRSRPARRTESSEDFRQRGKLKLSGRHGSRLDGHTSPHSNALLAPRVRG